MVERRTVLIIILIKVIIWHRLLCIQIYKYIIRLRNDLFGSESEFQFVYLVQMNAILYDECLATTDVLATALYQH